VQEPFCVSGKTVEQYLSEFFTNNQKKFRAVGFKLMLNQLTPEIMNYLYSNDIKCIYLERRNNFKLAVSRLTARKTSVYHSNNATNKPAMSLDIEALKKELRKIEEEKKEVERYRNNLNNISVKYEDFVGSKELEISKILRFLGVNAANVNSKLYKINLDDLNLVILNYEEVFAYFQQTKYSKFLTPLQVHSKPYRNLNSIYKCIFIHVPKAAGSSIEKALWGTKGEVGHTTAMDFKAADANLFEIYFSFAIVRNPFDRFVSAYEYLKIGGRNRFDKAWTDKYINTFSTFSSFVESLNDSVFRNKVLSWMHFKPQYKFVCDESKNVMVDFVGRYESLNEDFHHITQCLNVDVSLPYENSVSRKSTDSYFDESTRSIIYKIYKEDFELFGYA